MKSVIFLLAKLRGFQKMKRPLLVLYTAFCLAIVSTLAKADCKFTHPHHCIQSAGDYATDPA
jgi:hypothetical protein